MSWSGNIRKAAVQGKQLRDNDAWVPPQQARGAYLGVVGPRWFGGQRLAAVYGLDLPSAVFGLAEAGRAPVRFASGFLLAAGLVLAGGFVELGLMVTETWLFDFSLALASGAALSSRLLWAVLLRLPAFGGASRAASASAAAAMAAPVRVGPV